MLPPRAELRPLWSVNTDPLYQRTLLPVYSDAAAATRARLPASLVGDEFSGYSRVMHIAHTVPFSDED